MVDQFETLYSDTKKFFDTVHGGKLNVATVTALTRYSMEVIQKGSQFKNLKGSEKKALVIRVLKAIVDDVVESQEDKISPDEAQLILLAVDAMPYVIDATIDFAKVYLGTNGGVQGVKQKLCGCFKCCGK